MKVSEVMTSEPRTCTPDMTVADAAHQMWAGDCGVLPVVDDGELVGVVTDRDMYMALATRNEHAAWLKVGAVMTRKVVTGSPDDELSAALRRMAEAHVRRLPIVATDGSLLGILSMNDVVRVVGTASGPATEEVLAALRAICDPPRSERRKSAA
jgi:CBS domain-containing protein